MPEGVARAKRWTPGALRVGRAAAFLSIAMGVNGMVTPWVTGWDPRWLYVATVGIIAAVDGWLIGIVAAAGAVICYELMSFGTFSFSADRDAMLLAAAAVTAIVARGLRVTISRPRLAAAHPTPLLTGIVTPAVPETSAEVVAEAAALRAALEEERIRAERERNARLELERQSSAAAESARNELRESNRVAEETERRNADLQSALLAAEMEARSTASRIAEIESAVARFRSRAETAEEERDTALARVAELDAALQQLRAGAEDEEAVRLSLRERAGELDRLNADLRAALADVTAARDSASVRLEESDRERLQLAHRIAELEVSRDDIDARATDLQWSLEQVKTKLEASEAARQLVQHQITELDSANAELRAALDSTRNAHQQAAQHASQLEEANAQLRHEAGQLRFRLESEWSERLARNAVDITDRFNAALMTADARTDEARGEAARHAARAEELETELDAARKELADAAESAGAMQRQAAYLEAENSQIRAASFELRERIENEWRQQVVGHQDEIARLSEALSLAQAQKREAEAAATQLTARLAEIEEAKARIADLGSATAAADAEIAALRRQISEAEERAATAAAAREDERQRTEAAWSEKFARSAMELTQRFQVELAAAGEELARLRQAHDAESARVRELEAVNEDLRASVAAERQTLDKEWNEKLQTIVAHLAEDHEADIGQATLEKEEARAESRRLTKRLERLEAHGREIAAAFEELQKRNDLLRTEIDEQLRHAEAEKARADSAESLWSARMSASALELTQRFNGTMATADARLQEARHEAQAQASRVQELEQIIASLRASDQERRAAIDAEWSAKLETIVNHLATDHEADIGQAMLEREEARAEARYLSSQTAALKKNAAADREAFERERGEWLHDRDELTRTIEQLRRRLGLGTQSGSVPVPDVRPPVDRNPAVLVVHRDSAVRAIAKHALESSGYDVTTASDGLEAFRVAISQRPDVILAESTMPKMDGRELVQMLKSRPETANVKIVLMASSAADAGYAGGDFRADDFLRDPANIEALKSTLAHVLAARTM